MSYFGLDGFFFMDFALMNTNKAIRKHGIQLEGKNLMNSGYADDLSILDETIFKMNGALGF